MSNLHLVTGYAGQDHITAEDHGSFNAALTNGGSYVMNRGNKLSAAIINNSTVRVRDGDLLMQGRHVRLPESTYVDLKIETGTQGMYRHDLIVARYTRNNATGVEDCNLAVIKGTPAASDPSDPAYTSGDLLANHDTMVDFPLYRVTLDGLTPEKVEQLFEVITFVTVGADGKINNSFLPAMNFVPLSQKGKAYGVATLGEVGTIPENQIPELPYVKTSLVGAASGVATLDAGSKVPVAQLPSLPYVLTSAVGAASGVVPLNADKKIDKTYIPASDYDMTSETLPINYINDRNQGKVTITGTFRYTKIGTIVVAYVVATIVDTGDNPNGTNYSVTLDGAPSGNTIFVESAATSSSNYHGEYNGNKLTFRVYPGAATDAGGTTVRASLCYLTT